MLKYTLHALAVFAIAIGFSGAAPTNPVQASSRQNCGGLNQNSCFHINPARWCDEGLRYQPRPGRRGICVARAASPRPPAREQAEDSRRNCGGLNQNSCVHINPARWCDAGLQYRPRLGRRGTCVAKPAEPECGGLNQNSCFHINPARWCNEGLRYKPNLLRGRRGTCISRITNEDRLQVALATINALGNDNPLARLTRCLKNPRRLGDLRSAMRVRSRNGVNSVLRSCNVSYVELRNMGNQPALNPSVSSGNQTRSVFGRDGFFRTLSITIGGSGAAWVAGSASGGIVMELNDDPNARWYFTGGIGTGPKAEVVGDITVSLSRGEIPSGIFAVDHGTSAVVSGHYVVGLSGGVEFQENTLNFNGISFGAGGGVGAGGAVYKNGAVYPFPDF